MSSRTRAPRTRRATLPGRSGSPPSSARARSSAARGTPRRSPSHRRPGGAGPRRSPRARGRRGGQRPWPRRPRTAEPARTARAPSGRAVYPTPGAVPGAVPPRGPRASKCRPGSLLSLSNRAFEPLADARDGGGDEGIAQHTAEELARLTHDPLPLARERGALEQQRTACTGRPLERAVEAGFGRRKVTHAPAQRGRLCRQTFLLGPPRPGFALELPDRFVRVRRPPGRYLQVVT